MCTRYIVDAYTDLSAMVVEGSGLRVEDILYPGHLAFWPMRKTNTAMFTKY